MNRYIFFIGTIYLFSACGNTSQQKQIKMIESESVESSQIAMEAKFPFPEIPTMLTQPDERKAYLMGKHSLNYRY